MNVAVSPEKTPRFGLLGVGGPLLDWLCHVIRILQSVEGLPAVPENWVDTPEAIEALVALDPQSSFMVASQFPNRELITWLNTRRIPVIVALDSPARCVARHRHEYGVGIADAVRAVSRNLAAICQTRSLRLSVTVTHEHLGASTLQFCRALKKVCFGSDLNDHEAMLKALRLKKDVSILESINILQGYSENILKLGDIKTEDISFMSKIFDTKMALFTFDGAINASWSFEIFMDGELCKSPSRKMQYLVGPARCLYYGPYLHLPPGRYVGDYIFGLSDEIRDVHLKLEVVCGDRCEDFVSRATNGGIFALPFEFTVEEPSEQIELRLLIDRGEIEGRLAFVEAKIASVGNV